MTSGIKISYDPFNKWHKLARVSAFTAISLLGLIALWWVIAIIVDRTIIPTPLETWDALKYLVKNGDITTGRSVWTYISSSLGTFLKGFVLAFIVAFPLGLLLGCIKPLNELMSPSIEVLRPIAPVAWAPLFVVLWGYNFGPLMVVFVGIFFPLLTSVIFGVHKIDSNWIDAVKTLGATKSQIFTKVVVPASTPYLMNGVKVGLGIGWMCIVSAELYASPVGGLGFYISNMATIGYWPGVFAGIVLIGILGILTVTVADLLHKLISRKMGMEATS